LKVLDLFSGIGGFSLGFEWAGMETVAFCEFDKYCQNELKKNWPNVPIFDNIKTLKGDDVGPVDLICGGYPCQPFSLAGKRCGQEDDRHLWPEMLRIIKEVRPTWVVAENVTGHVTMGLDTVLSDLEGEGYSVVPLIIPACAVDAQHRRDRVWIIAHTICSASRDNRGVGDEGRSSSETKRKSVQPEHRKAHSNNPEPLCQTMANSNSSDGQAGRNESGREKGSNLGGRSAGTVVADAEGGINRPHNTGKEKRQKQKPREGRCGNPLADSNSELDICVGSKGQNQGEFGGGCGEARNWPPEPGVGRVAHGIPGRVDRLKALGNAVVPQVVEMIGKAIMAVERG